jgi:hypothetical protein
MVRRYAFQQEYTRDSTYQLPYHMGYQVILLVNDKIGFGCIDKAKEIFSRNFYSKNEVNIHVVRSDMNCQNRQF